MRPIPVKLRNTMDENPFMHICARPECGGIWQPVEWEHAMIYAGKQVNEEWAIIALCTFHHRGEGLDKNFNRWVALSRASLEDFDKHPKRNWYQEYRALDHDYGKRYDIQNILKFDRYRKVL